jgi:hypothetical protein
MGLPSETRHFSGFWQLADQQARKGRSALRSHSGDGLLPMHNNYEAVFDA